MSFKIICTECHNWGTRRSETDFEKNKNCKYCGSEVVKKEEFAKQILKKVNKIMPDKIATEQTDPFKYIGPVIFGIVVLFVVATIATNSFIIIDVGNRGVLKRWGQVTGDAFEPGLHFKIPIADTVDILDVKTQKLETKASAASGDMQIVTSTIALNYKVNPESVIWLRSKIGMDYKFKVIDPAIQEAIKAATTQFTAEELITKRPIVREEMKKNLQEKMQELTLGAIIVEDFNIINFDFSAEFNSAIEAKVTAEQHALKAERDLERIKFEAQQKIEQAVGEAESKVKVAQAEAEAIRIQSEALKENDDILQLRWIEAWDGALPYIYGSSGNEFIYDLNLGGE